MDTREIDSEVARARLSDLFEDTEANHSVSFTELTATDVILLKSALDEQQSKASKAGNKPIFDIFNQMSEDVKRQNEDVFDELENSLEDIVEAEAKPSKKRVGLHQLFNSHLFSIEGVLFVQAVFAAYNILAVMSGTTIDISVGPISPPLSRGLLAGMSVALVALFGFMLGRRGR